MATATAKTQPQPQAKAKNPSISRSAQAGIAFPVGRLARLMRQDGYAPRLAQTAPIYLAAVLEYITAEVLELAIEAAKSHKKKTVFPRHISLAIKNDQELNAILGNNCTIIQSGVMPGIHSKLLPPGKKVVAPAEDDDAEEAETPADKKKKAKGTAPAKEKKTKVAKVAKDAKVSKASKSSTSSKASKASKSSKPGRD